MTYQIPGIKPKKPDECIWCGKPVDQPHDRECDSCWELRIRIWANLDLAKEMIEFLEVNKELKGETNDD